jgi:hypothetical protein
MLLVKDMLLVKNQGKNMLLVSTCVSCTGCICEGISVAICAFH